MVKIIKDKMMNNICWMFGHNMYFDTINTAGPATCKRCGHKKPAIIWPRE